ncbi:MAG: MORN repeat-containing protein [Betaproteobacteria bacterium]
MAETCRVVDPELQGFYEGGCRNGLAQGKGHARGTAEYVGGFRKGLKHGKGTKTWPSGDRYEGEFVTDHKHGKGVYVWGSGSPWAGERYVGDYLDDRRHGWGTYYWPTGDRFEGLWKEDGRYGYTAMELRRHLADKARSEALTPGTQVCSRADSGVAFEARYVGLIETVGENTVQVRLLRLEGATDSPAAGALLSVDAADWFPCL